ncbi:MAG TPA: efflux RND transporter periplasmic adaptor subunit [Myxococcota bacterium]|jgi:membrane fusion protein (multidrug efflux system)
MRMSPSATLLAAALWVACSDEAPPPPVTDVVVAAVEQKDVPITMEWIGTTEGAVDAEIRAQVSGYLISRDYSEGTEVKKGALLFRIDPRSYQATLEQARGDLGRADAALAKARADVARYQPLAEQGAVSQQELDNAVQAARSGEASMQTARAAVDKAQLDLEFTRIRSPIDGIAGVAKSQLGDLVGPGDPEPLTSVSQLDTIRVSFPLSEREYMRFAQAARGVFEGSRQAEARLTLLLADGSEWPHVGRAVPAAAGVDPTTGTIMVRGEFANPDHILRVGQYARVRAVTSVLQGALTVPQRAVAEVQGVFQVAVVGKDNKVSMRVVETGPRFETDQVIEKGLVAGERVVVEGIQKVRDGAVVNPKPASDT